MKPATLSVFLSLSLILVSFALAQDLRELPRKETGRFIHTPAGPFPAECIHKVPSGTHVEERGKDVILRHHSFGARRLAKNSNCSLAEVTQKRQFPSYYDGWLAYTTWKYPQGIGKFYGNFSVPTTSPKNTPVLYLFTGLQNIDWIPKVDPIPNGPFDIIQPVLQYPADSGFGWSVKSWYVTLDAGVVVSDEIPVEEGEVIYSYMIKTGKAQWEIAAFNSKGQSTIIHPKAERLAAQPWAYNTLECYGCDDCSYEPTTPSYFTDLILQDTNGNVLTPTWTPSVSPHPKCKEVAVVNGPASVDIYFNGH